MKTMIYKQMCIKLDIRKFILKIWEIVSKHKRSLTIGVVKAGSLPSFITVHDTFMDEVP